MQRGSGGAQGDKSTAQIAAAYSLGTVCDACNAGRAHPLTQPVELPFAPRGIPFANIISFFTLVSILAIT